MTSPRDVVGLVAALVLALCAATPPADAASRYDSRLRFRTLRTTHFTIHFHQGEEAHARRLAGLAEQVRTDLATQFGLKAPRHTHVVLVDQTDSANGWSTPLPYNFIEITLTPPPPGSYLGYHDDWLRLVFTHEYAHTLHLDQVGGWMRPLRWLLGRHQVSFPNLFVPTWQIEGLATYAESLGGLGRVQAPHVRALTGSLSRADSTPHLDQLGGGFAGWPSGLAPYFYGGQLLANEARRAGDPAAVGAWARGTARRLPFFGGGAFTRVFGRSMRAAWLSFVPDGTVVTTAGVPGAVTATRLTHAGYASTSPRFDRTGARTGVWYASATAHAFPSLRLVGLDGRSDTSLATRVLGGGMGFWREWVVYDQHEFNGPVALFSDLWAIRGRDGRVVRLTGGTRYAEPDVSPDGTRAAAVVASDGQRDLVVLSVTASADGPPRIDPTPVARLTVQGCAFGSPRWSPDGTRLAAVVHCVGELPDIVVYDADLRDGARVAPDPAAHDVTPAWTPDSRWVLFASDRQAGHHRILAAAVADADQPGAPLPVIVDVAGGATQPDVSPDGEMVVFVSETAAGSEVFSARMPPLAPAGGAVGDVGRHQRVPVAPPAPVAAAAGGARADAVDTTADVAYSPWSTLLPRAWQPLAAIDRDHAQLGAAVAGEDALGRHSYGLRVWWTASGSAISEGWPDAAAFDWYASYTYDRWRPAVMLSASAESDTVGVRAAGTVVTAAARTHQAFGGVWYPVRRARWSQTLLAGVALDRQRILMPVGGHLDRTRHSLRAGWSFSSARRYGYSISPEHGVAASATVEYGSPALGADGRTTSGSAEWRAYLPGGFRHAVLALRAGAAGSTGGHADRRLFGTAAVGAASLLSFDRRRVGFVRGAGADAITGVALAGANADLRFPLARVDRGLGTWPLFLNQFHAALFVDGAAAGDSLTSLDRQIWSAGGEIAATITVAYGTRVTAAVGGAWTHDPRRADRPGRAAAFVRTGYAF